MIAHLRGSILEKHPNRIVIDVNGVGYLVSATPSVHRLGEGEVTVEVHTVVREDALQLYGFATADEREVFELLLGVNGVGPKVALAIVSGYSPAELRRAIAHEDSALFETIPGIGRKTAQRVVLELKDKVAPLVAVSGTGGEDTDGHVVARDALVELGYSAAEAEKRLADTDPSLPAAERVRQALRAA